MRPATDSSLKLGTRPSGDQIVVLHGVSWAEYDALCREGIGARLSYLDGELEIVSPGRRHEGWKKLLARLVEAHAEEAEISLNGFGSETFKRKLKKAGVEPDECYRIGDSRLPAIAIEVVDTSGGIDKLEIYERLGIPEVWFWENEELRVYRLSRSGYRRLKRSVALRDLDLDEIASLVRDTDDVRQTEAVRAYRARLRRRRQ